MQVIKNGCNHGNKNNSSEILHEVRKQTLLKYNFMLFTKDTNQDIGYTSHSLHLLLESNILVFC